MASANKVSAQLEQINLAETLAIYEARLVTLNAERAELIAKIEQLKLINVTTTIKDTPQINVDHDIGESSSSTKFGAKQARNAKRKKPSEQADQKSTRQKVCDARPKTIHDWLSKKINYQDLSTFKAEEAPVNEKELNTIIDALDILMRSHAFHNLNEAGRSVFIELVLSLAVVNLSVDAVIKPQYRLRKYEFGLCIPDWVIKQSNQIILTVEAKARNVNDGINQNLRQLYRVYKEIQTPVMTGWQTFHGLVTTANEWVFIKAMFNGNECRILRSAKSPWKLPLNSGCAAKEFKSQFRQLATQLVWFLRCPKQ
jgi:hypothetical protein